jgi:acyl-CoA synthetase (AMP-forming)/AMP-acid ligase II
MYPGTFARTDPGRIAAVMARTGEQLSYAELDDRSRRLSRLLYDAGLRRGDVIALFTDNALPAFEVYWAAMRSGLYLTAVNSHLTADEAGYIVADSGARALVVSAALGELAAAMAAGATAATTRLAYGGTVPGCDSYEAALETVGHEDVPELWSGTTMLYSSGTTGRPKGVRPSLPEHKVDEQDVALTMLARFFFDFDGEPPVYLSPAPLYHAAPLRWCGTVQAVGGTVVLMDRFDAAAALEAIERYRVTHSQWVPTHFVRMLRLPEEERQRYDLSSHRVAVHAASPCPVDVKRAMIDWWGPILREYYSSTEGSGFTVIDSAQWAERPGSVGKPVLGMLRICDADGRELPPGEPGTVYFEQEQAPFEYLHDQDKTRASRHPDHPNWTTVGDMGYADSGGFLYLTDRKAFMIISGGVNIYPQEIENALALHPAVADVAVIGVPNPEMGEEVKAVVQPLPDAKPGDELAAELTAYLRGRVAGFKIPRSFAFVTELPRTPTGKLLKNEVKKAFG